MKKSLQSIEDHYKNQGYSGDKLRNILMKEFQKLLKERKKQVNKRFPLTKNEQKKYVMSTDEDYEILNKIKKLEKRNSPKKIRPL